MRYINILLLVMLFLQTYAQPVNDNCNSALTLTLGTIINCPDEDVLAFQFSASNIEATTTNANLELNQEFGNGPQIIAPYHDVWYAFTAPANRIELRITGAIQNPVIVLFQADSCNNKLPLQFAKAANNDGTVSLTSKVNPGKSYLLMLASENENDEGDVTLTAKAYNDCSTCGKRYGQLSAFPSPDNGTYMAGQEVQFCYTIDLWDPGFSFEWLHALQIKMGEGWDKTSLSYTLPTSCTPGNWEWYDNWQSCNTTLNFGPGFAFDAQQGLLCPGATPNDGDPGNNFGDGPCGSPITANPLPLEFCWTISVKNTFSTNEEKNLNLELSLLGDGYSGSWMSYSCADEASTEFLATAVPAQQLLPDLQLIKASCANDCNGQLQVAGQGNSNWTYTLYDNNGNIVYTAPAYVGIDTIENLCSGNYNFELAHISGVTNQTVGVHIPEQNIPEVQIGYLPSCNEGDPYQLATGVYGSFTSINYQWTGPNNYTSSQSSPIAFEYGTYQMDLTIDGCQLLPLIIETKPLRTPISCEADASTITFSWEPLAQDTAYEVSVITGQSGVLQGNSFIVDNLSPAEEVDIMLTAKGIGYCNESIQEASCQALSCEPLSLLQDTILCGGDSLELNIDDTGITSIEWAPSAGLSCTDCYNPIFSPVVTTSYTVTIERDNGCLLTESFTVFVEELPEVILSDSAVYCPGLAFEFCLPEENNYIWISPIGSIHSGNCLTFPYTNQNIAGEYRIRVRRPDGCQFFESLILYPDPGCLDGIEIFDYSELQLNNPLRVSKDRGKIYPNPTADFVNIEFATTGKKSVLLLSMNGHPIQKNQMEGSFGMLDIQGLLPGTYMLKVAGTSESWQEKLIVVR